MMASYFEYICRTLISKQGHIDRQTKLLYIWQGRGECNLHQAPTTSNWGISKRQLNRKDGHKSNQVYVLSMMLNPRFVGYDEQDWKGKSKETPNLIHKDG